ncbi:MAG: HD domain-containing protein [Lachnospiraceae bacterium]|nr:HD domain-containing protein [Lachnospiraceae bacterium]MBR4082708.1 HD domain-containing protein [Lachnospiraceae bacterium]
MQMWIDAEDKILIAGEKLMGKNDFMKSENRRLNQQLLFTAEIDKMADVMRQTLLINKSRQENDAEHSWHIAVMAMLFSEYAIEPVNVGRVVQMCVVHDIVEIEAGDTFAYDAQGNVNKAEREKEAADKLFAKLPADQGKMIRDLWEEFDAMETADAKYAACMDRIQPFIHNTLTDGHTWVKGKVDRKSVERRAEIVKEFMPEVYNWMVSNMVQAVEKGWLAP